MNTITKELHSVAVAFMVLMLSVQVSAASLFEKYPLEEQVELSDGNSIWLPLHIYNSKGLVLFSTADLNFLKSQLRPHGIEPLEITKGRGLVLMYGMQYLNTTIGSYNELVISVAATQKKMKVPFLERITGMFSFMSSFLPLVSSSFDGLRKDFPFFTWKLFVTTSISMNAGIEIWGYPKTLAEISVSVDDNLSHFEVVENGRLVISAERNGRKFFAPKVTMDLRLLSPLTHKQVLSHGLAVANASTSGFSKDDKLQIGEGTHWGRDLLAMDLKPIGWQNMKSFKAVFLNPNKN